MTKEQRKISFELTYLMSRTKNEDARKGLVCALAAYTNWVNHGIETTAIEFYNLQYETKLQQSKINNYEKSSSSTR